MGAKVYELASFALWIVAFVMTERDDAPESFTVIVTSSLALNKLSFAVRRNTYVPLCEKVAVVTTAFVLPNVIQERLAGRRVRLPVVFLVPGEDDDGGDYRFLGVEKARRYRGTYL